MKRTIIENLFDTKEIEQLKKAYQIFDEIDCIKKLLKYKGISFDDVLIEHLCKIFECERTKL